MKNQPESNNNAGFPHSHPEVFPQEHIIPIYIGLSVLNKMKLELGLEAMLEYMNKYLQIVDEYNPKLQYAVSQALKMISVEKIYHEATHDKQE